MTSFVWALTTFLAVTEGIAMGYLLVERKWQVESVGAKAFWSGLMGTILSMVILVVAVVAVWPPFSVLSVVALAVLIFPAVWIVLSMINGRGEEVTTEDVDAYRSRRATGS